MCETGPLSEAQRLELARKLDRDLEDFIDGLERRSYADGWPEDRWQEEMEKHPFFMKKAPEAGDSLHPLLEGLQKLKYDPDENTPEELANAYKDDGNFNFKHKNYRLAVIAYTEAIKVRCGNAELDAALYNNRSAAHYFLENYRSALRDAAIALRLKPDYEKVRMRAANCCYETKRYDEGIEHCDELLARRAGDEEALKLRRKCANATKSAERDARRQKRKDAERERAENSLLREIERRALNIQGVKDGLKLEHLRPIVPELADHGVYLNQDGALTWPVIWIYPEYGVMDFVQRFVEDESLQQHLDEMLRSRPEWDLEKRYGPGSVNVYYENQSMHRLVKAEPSRTLKEIVSMKTFEVRGGVPSFIVFAKQCPAEITFLKRYGAVS